MIRKFLSWLNSPGDIGDAAAHLAGLVHMDPKLGGYLRLRFREVVDCRTGENLGSWEVTVRRVRFK